MTAKRLLLAAFLLLTIGVLAQADGPSTRSIVQRLQAGGATDGVFGTIVFKHSGGTGELTECYVGSAMKGTVKAPNSLIVKNVPLVGQKVHFEVPRTGEKSPDLDVPLSSGHKTYTVLVTVQ